MVWFLHWLIHVTGSDYGMPYGHFSFYDLESGFGSDLTEFGILAAIFHAYWRTTCHEPKCWRPGHLMADQHTRSCWTHNPDGRPKPGHVARKHREHQEHLATRTPQGGTPR